MICTLQQALDVCTLYSGCWMEVVAKKKFWYQKKQKRWQLGRYCQWFGSGQNPDTTLRFVLQLVEGISIRHQQVAAQGELCCTVLNSATSLGFRLSRVYIDVGCLFYTGGTNLISKDKHSALAVMLFLLGRYILGNVLRVVLGFASVCSCHLLCCVHCRAALLHCYSFWLVAAREATFSMLLHTCMYVWTDS